MKLTNQLLSLCLGASLLSAGAYADHDPLYSGSLAESGGSVYAATKDSEGQAFSLSSGTGYTNPYYSASSSDSETGLHLAEYPEEGEGHGKGSTYTEGVAAAGDCPQGMGLCTQGSIVMSYAGSEGYLKQIPKDKGHKGGHHKGHKGGHHKGHKGGHDKEEPVYEVGIETYSGANGAATGEYKYGKADDYSLAYGDSTKADYDGTDGLGQAGSDATVASSRKNFHTTLYGAKKVADFNDHVIEDGFDIVYEYGLSKLIGPDSKNHGNRKLLTVVDGPNLVVGTKGGSKVKQVNGAYGKSGQVNVASAVHIPDYYEGSQSKSLTRSEQSKIGDPRQENYATSYGNGMAGLECSNAAIGEDGAYVAGNCGQFATSYQQSLAGYNQEHGAEVAANGGGVGFSLPEDAYSHKGSTSMNINLAGTNEYNEGAAGGYSYATTGRANSKKKLLKNAGWQSDFDKYTVEKETWAVLDIDP